MTLKHILLHLDAADSCTARVEAAIGLASRHGAHVTGLYVLPDIVYPAYVSVHIPADILRAQQQRLRDEAEKTGTVFQETLARAGVAGEWRCVEGFAERQIRLHARYSDLVVIGQTEENPVFPAYAELPDQVVLGAARPVLLIPYIGFKEPPGKRILVAWNGSREAVRAVHDALPILQQAERVEVLAVNPPAAEGDIPTADICLHLARHDVRAEASQTMTQDIDVGDILLARVSDHDIDLLVVGAYGHSRLRESVLGGVTRYLLEHMTVPVLMSH
jgi:nucleotide-binding universal stress UspA family protein